MWRLVGLLFFGDKNHFVIPGRKAFCQERLEAFLQDRGIALYDTASAVCRLQDNASDKYLQVVTPTDVFSLLRRLPQCQAVAVTGQKAADTLCAQLSVSQPGVGHFVPFEFEGRSLRFYRMPSSSRAYPLALEQKAAAYRVMYQDLGML